MLIEIPTLATLLIAELDKMYPHKCPGPKDGEREMWMYAGKRELVDSLLFHLKSDEAPKGLSIKK